MFNQRKHKWMKNALAVFLCVALLAQAFPADAFAVEMNPPGDRIIVSLGDSYSSGEGIEPFYGQDLPLEKRVKNEDWLAHRSENAWAGMLTLPGVEGTMAKHRYTDDNTDDPHWYFAAISGAETRHFNEEKEKEYNKSGHKDKVNLPAQKEIFDALGDKKADYVTLTMGGNDADFTGIITGVVLGNSYLNYSGLALKLNHTWKKFYEDGGIADNLRKMYSNIAAKAGDQAHIIVAGYPKLLAADGSIATMAEANLVNTSVSNFNNAIEHIVQETSDEGINISFVSVEDAFEGREAYTDEAYINEIKFGPKLNDQDLTDYGVSSAYSMHPNIKGAQAYAACVQDEIDELEGMRAIPYAKDFTISTYDADGKLADDYTIIVDGWQNLALWGFIGKDYYQEIDVNKATPQEMHLPKGTFTITVTDGDITYSQKISTTTESENNTLIFNTEFSRASEEGEEGYVDIPTKTTSDERDIVLVLDTSSSMDGEPIEETRQAASKFVDTALEEDASVGLVTYSGAAEMQTDFSVSRRVLDDIIEDIDTDGSTNIEDGLKTANGMLEESNAKKKIILLMSDGEPNVGKVGDDLIAYADELKDQGITIYTLGFFENMSGSKSSAQILMEGIASEGCHYEVASAEDLVFFFNDIADQISGQRYIYVRIACPVDVNVEHDGEILSSSEEYYNTRTAYGTLTFEESEEASYGTGDNRIKILRLKEGPDYNLRILGTGEGAMNYTIGFMDEEGEYADFRNFRNIAITPQTIVDTKAAVARKTVLNIDEDGDGKYDKRMSAKADSLGKEVMIIRWQHIALVVIALAAVVAYMRRKRKTGKDA